MDGGETTNSFAFNFFSSSSSSGGKGEEEKRTTTETTNAKETTKTTIQKPEAKRVHSKDVFEPVFAKAVDKETVEIFSSDEEEEEGRAKVLMMSIEKKIPPLGKEEVRMRVPTLDAVCKNNNEKPAKGAKAPPSAASAYSLASHDLVKGKYEGGLKLWECAIDLTKYVVRERVVEAMVTLSKSKSFRVLELGCGHGVPGIASLMAREKMEKDGKDTTLLCTLADYNEEVLTEVTIPNARLNGVCEQCTFLAGDWDDLVAAPSKKQSEAFLSKDEFDLILTSDTIYNVDDAKKLAKVIHHCLKKNANENAIALVAAFAKLFA